MKITFADNTEFEYLNAIETEEYYNGSNRRTLTFDCAKDAIGLDALNAILSVEDNTKTIKLTNEDIVNYYNDYVLNIKCGMEKELTAAETTTSAAVYEDRIVFKLAKRTYIEQKLYELGVQ